MPLVTCKKHKADLPRCDNFRAHVWSGCAQGPSCTPRISMLVHWKGWLLRAPIKKLLQGKHKQALRPIIQSSQAPILDLGSRLRFPDCLAQKLQRGLVIYGCILCFFLRGHFVAGSYRWRRASGSAAVLWPWLLRKTVCRWPGIPIFVGA